MGATLNSCLYEITLLALEDKKKIKEIMRSQGINSVAIYGLGRLGLALNVLLKKSDVNIVYGLDIDRKKHVDGLRVLHPNDDAQEHVDIIIITPLKGSNEIIDNLKSNNAANIIKVSDFLEELIIATTQLD